MKKTLAALAIVLLTASGAWAQGIAVIANSSFPKDSLTAEQVKDIYLGKTGLIEGTKVQPVDQKDSDSIKRDFLKKVVDTSADEYKVYWMKRAFREGGSPPGVKNSSEDVINSVREGKGSIGYVWDDEARGKNGVKVIFTVQ